MNGPGPTEAESTAALLAELEIWRRRVRPWLARFGPFYCGGEDPTGPDRQKRLPVTGHDLEGLATALASGVWKNSIGFGTDDDLDAAADAYEALGAKEFERSGMEAFQTAAFEAKDGGGGTRN